MTDIFTNCPTEKEMRKIMQKAKHKCKKQNDHWEKLIRKGLYRKYVFNPKL